MCVWEAYVCVGMCVVSVCVCVCVKRIEFFILNYMLAYNDKWLRVSMCVCECEWNVHVCVCVCIKKTFVRLCC